MSHVDALVDEIANELDTWPGVRLDRAADGSVVVHYGQLELGVLDPQTGVATLPFSGAERDALVEHGDAEPAEPRYDDENVSHDVAGPSDVTAVLELFDRRYREVRGDDAPYSSSDPG